MTEKLRLDIAVAKRGLVASRSQAESYIRLGQVKVNGRVVTKNGYLVDETDNIAVVAEQQFVSRAALKLKSADEVFKIDWRGKTVLDVGSSTGGFTQYALLKCAAKVIAVDVGTDQMHQSLVNNPKIELHEKTDIRNVKRGKKSSTDGLVFVDDKIDIIVLDVSFVSLREILPHVAGLASPSSQLIAMVKPQFEAGHANLKHKGVIKNDALRRKVLKSFEEWVQKLFKIQNKADSKIAGAKGNLERFYLLKTLNQLSKNSSRADKRLVQ